MNHLEELRHAIACLDPLERQEEEAHTDCPSPVSEYMTREEFLQFQERSSIQYEYINGIIRQIIGPSVAHCMVTQNLVGAIRTRLQGRQCKAFSSGIQLDLALEDDQVIYRPDLFVVCESEGWCKDYAGTPKLVVEVISPSTHYIDKREKLVNYRRVPSLDEYVVVAQKCVELTIYRRTEDWAPKIVNSLHASAQLCSLGFSIPLVEIYEHVFSGRIVSNSKL